MLNGSFHFTGAEEDQRARGNDFLKSVNDLNSFQVIYSGMDVVTLPGVGCGDGLWPWVSSLVCWSQAGVAEGRWADGEWGYSVSNVLDVR